MNAKWFALVITIYVYCIVFGWTFDGSAAWAGTGGYSASPVATLQSVIASAEAHQSLPLIGKIAFVVFNPNFYSALFGIATLQFTFMTGLGFIYFLVITPFAVLSIISLGLLIYGIIRGNVVWG